MDNITFKKQVFLENLNNLLRLEGKTHIDIYKNTSINRTTLKRILDPEHSATPDIYQMLELCDLLNTTLYYLIAAKGARYSTSNMSARMLEIMNAYTDKDRPDISLIINLIIRIHDYETLLMIRELAFSVAETKNRLSDNITNQEALKRQPA